MYEVQHEQKRSKVYTLYLLCDAVNIFIQTSLHSQNMLIS